MQRNRNLNQYIILVLCLVMLAVCFQIPSNHGASSLQAATTLGRPELTIVSRTASSVNLKYTKVSGATGYQIYRSTTKDGTYTKVKTTTSLTFKDNETVSSKVYYYKVRAYKKGSSNTTYSSFSTKKAVKAILGKASDVSASSISSGIKLSWKTVSKATAYRIYRSTSKSGTYQYYASTKNLTYIDKNVTSGTTYYYKVRSYAVLSSVKYYGSYSSVVSAKASSSQSYNGNSSYEEQVIAIINEERRAEGLSAVTTTTALQNAAFHRAMETAEVFSHTRPDGSSFSTVLGEYNITYTACGENIAYGQQTPESVMEAWMNSSGHRSNILSSKYGKVGIGYYVVNNTPYWVQVFTN